MKTTTPILPISTGTSTLPINAKLEGTTPVNPTGSIKDRFARYTLHKAERSGQLHKGMTIVELSAGNTAVALAHQAKLKGYKLHLFVPEPAYATTAQRIAQTGLASSDYVLKSTSMSDQSTALTTIDTLCADPDFFWTQQYYRNDSAQIYASVAAELERQLPSPLLYVAAACGTAGTAVGLARNLDVTVLAVFAKEGSFIPGIRPLGARAPPYKDLKDILDTKTPNMQEFSATTTQATHGVRLLRQNAIHAGLSGGAALSVLLKQLDHAPVPKTDACAVVLIADGYAIK